MLAVECSNKTCIYVHLPIIKSVKKSIQQYQGETKSNHACLCCTGV